MINPIKKAFSLDSPLKKPQHQTKLLTNLWIYVAEYQIGEFQLDVSLIQEEGDFALLNVSNNENSQIFSPASFGNSQNLKLAQTVISLSGQIQNTVSTGIITGLDTAEGSLTEEDAKHFNFCIS